MTRNITMLLSRLDSALDHLSAQDGCDATRQSRDASEAVLRIRLLFAEAFLGGATPEQIADRPELLAIVERGSAGCVQAAQFVRAAMPDDVDFVEYVTSTIDALEHVTTPGRTLTEGEAASLARLRACVPAMIAANRAALTRSGSPFSGRRSRSACSLP